MTEYKPKSEHRFVIVDKRGKEHPLQPKESIKLYTEYVKPPIKGDTVYIQSVKNNLYG